MFRPAVLLLGVIVSCAALTGCAHKPVLTPEGEVVIEPADGTKQFVAVKLHNVVRIKLPPVRTAGHAWTIVANDYRFLKPHEPLVAAPDGRATVAFFAVRQGRRPLRFFALPPGVVVVPSQAAEIVVTIQ